MGNVQTAVTELAGYALRTGLIEKEDILYSVNSLLGILQLDAWEGSEADVEARAKAFTEEELASGLTLEQILGALLDDAASRGLLDGGSVVARDLYDTRLMGALTARPSDVIRSFRAVYAEDPEKATEWYYAFSRNTDYIRRYRIARDRKWKTATEYGELDVTINLSKPEKDPKAIAAARTQKQSGYPKCQLCRENEGYYGRLNHPARENHRIIPITINGSQWGFQYSPYVYYNEHCIVFNGQHVPMAINHDAFMKLFDFVEQFPHYFLGSNADLPIVGGSILTHDHFQGGRYTFAMEKAPVERTFTVPGFEDVQSGIVKWPMSCIRLNGTDRTRVIALADHILASWRGYTDADAFIFAETEEKAEGAGAGASGAAGGASAAGASAEAAAVVRVPHNTITPIARRHGDVWELDLVLRNNITTEEHPLGVYHPHAELHHIKKENIGLIEVMGLAVLPARLKGEMELLRRTLLSGDSLRDDAVLAQHADWAEEFIARRGLAEPLSAGTLSEEALETVIEEEIGAVFCRVLEDAGVFKRDAAGQAAFDRFTKTL